MRQKKLPEGVYMQVASPEALRAYLKHKRMSYADLGSLVGVSKQFIGQLATGTRTTCRPETARRIEMVLLPPPELRSPQELPLFVQRVSNVDGEKAQKRRSGALASCK